MTSLFWRDGAACTLKDAATFDELDAARRGDAHHRIEAAKAVCRTCPLITFCFQQGVQGRESGVWGGALLENGRIRRTPAAGKYQPRGRAA